LLEARLSNPSSQFTKAEVMRLCEQSVLDVGYGPCAAILMLGALEKILERGLLA
jgi:hypothetical protein